MEFQDLRDKPPIPTLLHWEQAEIAAKSAWKKRGLDYVDKENCIHEAQLHCMESYEVWDPKITPWFGWCCFLAKRKLNTILASATMERERLTEDFSYCEPTTPSEFPTLHHPEVVYDKLHPFDKWVVSIRMAFSTGLEACSYLRLCGLSTLQIKRSQKRICNATTPNNLNPYNERRCSIRDELDALLQSCLAQEKTLTMEQIQGIMKDKFCYRQSRQVCEDEGTRQKRKYRYQKEYVTYNTYRQKRRNGPKPFSKQGAKQIRS